MADAVTFAVVGLGMGAARAREITRTPGTRLAAVVDRDRERADNVAGELGCEALYDISDLVGRDDIQVAHILTPSGSHAEVAIPLAEAGKHILMTKPLEITLERCDRIIDACTRAGVTLMMDYQFRYSTEARLLKHALATGFMGKPVFGEAMLKWHRAQSYFEGRGSWHGTWAGDGGGSLMNQTIHLLDLLLWVMGPVRRVQGLTSIQTHRIETEDVGMAMLEYESGAVGRILGTTTYVGNDVFHLAVHGEEGGAVLNLGAQGVVEWKFLKDHEKTPPAIEEPYPANAMDDLAQVLTGKRSLCADAAGGRAAVELVLAVYESARHDGRRVTLPLAT